MSITSGQESCRKVLFSVVSVCLFRGVPMCTGTLTPPDMGPHCKAPLASELWWQRCVTCSNLFTWGKPPPHHCWHLVVTEGHMGGKWVVRILLEYFLVSLVFERLLYLLQMIKKSLGIKLHCSQLKLAFFWSTLQRYVFWQEKWWLIFLFIWIILV